MVKSHEPTEVAGFTSALGSAEADSTLRRTKPSARDKDSGRRLNNAALERLRAFRADIQDLRAVLQSVRIGEASLLTFEDYIQCAESTIDADLDAVEETTSTYDDGSAVCHLRNLWQQMKTCLRLLHPGQNPTAQEQLQWLNMLDTRSREVTYQVGVLTIPERLNDWLSRARSGYYVPFHAVFDDEVPDYDDRAKILRYLAWSPVTIDGGIVDGSSGLIYRYSHNVWMRFLSVGMAMLAFVLATAAVYIAPTMLPQLGNQRNFLIAWGAVLAGILVHIAVSTAKRMQVQTELPPVIALSDVPRLLDAKLGQTLMKPLLALFGLFGLAFTAGESQVTILNAFLVGYSLDSIVQLFAASVEQRAATQVTALKQQLGVTTGT
jgi:hypothetical protein